MSAASVFWEIVLCDDLAKRLELAEQFLALRQQLEDGEWIAAQTNMVRAIEHHRAQKAREGKSASDAAFRKQVLADALARRKRSPKLTINAIAEALAYETGTSPRTLNRWLKADLGSVEKWFATLYRAAKIAPGALRT